MFKKTIINGLTGLIFSLGFNYNVISAEKYEYGIKLTENTEISLEKKLDEYDQEFKIYKPNFKRILENNTKINIKGDYSFFDYKLLEKVFEIYGEEWIKKLGLKDVVFLPEEYILYNKYREKMSGKIDVDYSVIGLAYENSSKIIVESRESPNVLFHELSHIYHLYIEKIHPEFNENWKNISGGYINKFQFESEREDIAELSEAIIMYGYEYGEYDLFRILYKLPVFDGNFKSISKKIKLLQIFGFLPKHFYYGELSNK